MISGFHAKGNPWPPLRSAASTTNPFLLLVSRSRYAIIRKRLISLPVFKKNETKHTFGICHVNLFIRWTKKRICFAVCTNDSRENGYNRLGKEDMLLFSGRRKEKGRRLNRLHSFKWELFPYPVELKKNNEGI